MIKVARDIKGTDVQDYIDAFRLHICRDCRSGGDTDCNLRDDGLCDLDQYFPLVLEAIEKVERRHSV
jgi:hypothetical protein